MALNNISSSKQLSKLLPQNKKYHHQFLEYASLGFATIASLLVFAPIFLSYIRYLFRLTKNPNPNLGWAETILSDSIRVASGIFPLGDPSFVPVGQLYGLGYPLLNGILLSIYPWAGWTLLLNIFSVTIGISISTFLALRFLASSSSYGCRKLLIGLTIASGFSGISLIALALPKTNLLFEGRTDHFAWVVTILGIVLASKRISQRYSRAFSIFLLTYGFHSKFTVLPLILALFIVAELMTMSLPEERQKFRRLFLLFSATNIIVITSLEILSGGWYLRLTLLLPMRHAKMIPLSEALTEILALIAILIILFSIFFVKSSIQNKGSEVKFLKPDFLLVNTFILSLLMMMPLAVLARIKQGASDNQYIGIIWIVIFCSGIFIKANRLTNVGVGHRALTSVALLSLFVMFLPTGVHGSNGISLRNSIRIEANKGLPQSGMANFTSDSVSSPGLSSVYSPYAASRSFKKSDQNPLLFNIVDLLAAGYQPTWFFEKVSTGKIVTKELFDVGHSELYASAYGLQDFGALSALNKFGLTHNDTKQLFSCTKVIVQKHIRLVRVNNQGFLCHIEKQALDEGKPIFNLKVEETSRDYWVRLDSKAKGKVILETQTKLNYVTVGREIFTPGKDIYLDSINTYLDRQMLSCEQKENNKIMIDLKRRTLTSSDLSGRVVCSHKYKSSEDIYLGISNDIKITITP